MLTGDTCKWHSLYIIGKSNSNFRNCKKADKFIPKAVSYLSYNYDCLKMWEIVGFRMRVVNCFWVKFELSFGACRVKVFGFECDVNETAASQNLTKSSSNRAENPDLSPKSLRNEINVWEICKWSGLTSQGSMTSRSERKRLWLLAQTCAKLDLLAELSETISWARASRERLTDKISPRQTRCHIPVSRRRTRMKS